MSDTVKVTQEMYDADPRIMHNGFNVGDEMPSAIIAEQPEPVESAPEAVPEPTESVEEPVEPTEEFQTDDDSAEDVEPAIETTGKKSK